MTIAASDHLYMARALRLAERGLFTTDPNPRVGCVIVADGEVIGEGWHVSAGEPHAEAHALKQAGAAAAGGTAYISLEPCCHQGRTAPCSERLIEAGLGRVVYAADDPNPAVAGQGASRIREAGIAVDAGLMAAASRDLNPGFFSRMERKRPWIRSKLAISMDGRTALSSGESKWITGEAARADVQRWRARSSAILTGVGTVLADNPSLNLRDSALDPALPPGRLILDSSLRTPPTAKIFSTTGRTVVFYCDDSAGTGAALEQAGAELHKLPEVAGRVSLQALTGHLAEMEINEVLVEAGPDLNGSLLDAGLIDELIVYMASHVLGNDSRGMFGISALQQMSERIELQLLELRRVGDDCLLRYRPMER